MKHKKYIIIYNECLRSKIIFFDFLKKNSNLIRAVIKLPITSKSTENNNSLFLPIRVLKKSSMGYIVYSIFQTIIYSLISKIFKSEIRDLCSKKKIEYHESEKFPNRKYLKKEIPGYQKKDIFLISIANILKKRDLSIENVVLNFHESDPRYYRGIGICHEFALSDKKKFKTVIMEPNEGIDTGRIILFSQYNLIKKYSVFKIYLTGYFSQSKLINKIKKINITKKFPKNTKKVGKYFTFPNKETEKAIKLNGKKIFSIADFFFMYKLFKISNNDKFYKTIKVYLKNEN